MRSGKFIDFMIRIKEFSILENGYMGNLYTNNLKFLLLPAILLSYYIYHLDFSGQKRIKVVKILN